MIIDLPKISPDGSSYEGEEPPAILDLAGADPIRAADPITYDFFAQIVSDKLVIQGRVSTTLSLECTRCAQFFSTIVSDSSFLRDYELSSGLDKVDITDDIREAILLSCPPYSVCNPDCKGLCARCGLNLNEGSCDCSAPTVDIRWSELDRLK